MPSKSGPPTKGALVEVDGRYRFARKERNPVSSALRILRVAQSLVAGVFLPKTCPRGPPLRWFRTGQRSLHCRVCFLLKLGVARRSSSCQAQSYRCSACKVPQVTRLRAEAVQVYAQHKNTGSAAALTAFQLPFTLAVLVLPSSGTRGSRARPPTAQCCEDSLL